MCLYWVFYSLYTVPKCKVLQLQFPIFIEKASVEKLSAFTGLQKKMWKHNDDIDVILQFVHKNGRVEMNGEKNHKQRRLY